MNPASAIPLRYVVAPAVAQLYEEDKEGFDAVTEEPVLAKLSNENDQVSGLEHIYGYILNNRPTAPVMFDDVSGSEGFIDTIKSSVSSAIKAVKDFFKWIWSFFGSKKKIIENKAEDIAKQVDAHGAKDGDIPYPKSVAFIYLKAGKPEPNINWLSTAITNAAKAIDKTIKYAALLKGLSESAHKSLLNETTAINYTDINEEFNKEVATAFGITGAKAISLLSLDDLTFKDGRFAYHINIQSQRNASGAVFHTTTSQLQTYVKEYHALEGKLDDMTKEVHALEGKFIKTLENQLLVAGRLTKSTPQAKKSVDDTRALVRSAMANIKVLQSAVFRSSNAILDVIAVATKKG